jgi:hypothetical protein
MCTPPGWLWRSMQLHRAFLICDSVLNSRVWTSFLLMRSCVVCSLILGACVLATLLASRLPDRRRRLTGNNCFYDNFQKVTKCRQSDGSIWSAKKPSTSPLSPIAAGSQQQSPVSSSEASWAPPPLGPAAAGCDMKSCLGGSLHLRAAILSDLRPWTQQQQGGGGSGGNITRQSVCHATIMTGYL